MRSTQPSAPDSGWTRGNHTATRRVAGQRTAVRYIAARSWTCRISVTHVRDTTLSPLEPESPSFGCYAGGLDASPDVGRPAPNTAGPDVRMLVEEARLGCTPAMLLWHKWEQRLVYILG